ncbi:MAG: DNA-directed RNA polymerase subunit P [Candidatus Hodarchaeales archaeon]
MTTYLCQKCHTEIDPAELETLPGIRCIICGHRILLKKRPPIIKRLKTS